MGKDVWRWRKGQGDGVKRHTDGESKVDGGRQGDEASKQR